MTKIVHETELKYTEVGLDGITKQVDSLIKLIDTLPVSGKKSNEAIQGIVNSLKALRSNGLEQSLGSTEAKAGVKELQNQLKTLATISKALELFKDSDLKKSQAQEKALRDIEKSYRTLLKATQIQEGTLGLGAATAKDAKAAEETLRAHLDKKAKMLKDAQTEYNKLARQEKSLSKAGPAESVFVPGTGFTQVGQSASRLSEVQARLAELRALKAELSSTIRTHKQNMQAIAREQERAMQQKLLDVQTKNQAKGNALNAEGLRSTQYQQIKNQERGNYLKEWTERQEELKRRAISEARQVQEFKAKAELDALNQTGARQAEIRRRAIEQKRQTEEYQARLKMQQLNETGSRAVQYQQVRNQERGNLFQQAQERQMFLRSTSLQSIYSQNNLSVPSARDDITAGTKVRDLTAQIVAENKKLLELKRAGQLTAAEESKILEKVKTLQTQRTQEQHSQNMLNRASGERGASLLAVQAALMANYTIINTITGSLRAAISTSIELEAAFRNVQAVTGTTNTEMRSLEGTIKTVAASSKFTSLEVANAALTLGQAGLSAKQVGEALGAVVMLASAAGTSIAQAVDLVTSIIGVFDKRATDVEDIANKVTQAANASKVSVEKLALGFQYAGNTAAQMGITFEETTAAMAAMSNAGIKNGSTMGTGLRSFLTELQKPSEAFIETLRRIGLSVGDLDVKTYGLIGVTKRLREAGFTANDAMKSFDIRSASAFNAMVGNPEEMERQYRLLLQTTAGVEANEIQMDSLKSQSARLTTSLGNLASAGLEPLSKLLAMVAGGLATVTQFMSENRVMTGVLGTAIAALIAGGFAGYLSSVVVGLRGLLPVLTVTSLGVNGLTAAFTGLSFSMGFGLVIAGLTAAFAAYQFVTGSTAAELDRLKAAASEAKGALEEKSGTVSSLEKKIESLNYRQSTLTEGSDALKTAAMEVTSQFGHLGFQADQNNLTFETMISKLKNLKSAMEEVRRQELLNAQSANQNLFTAQTTDLQKSVGSFAGNNWQASRQIKGLADLPKGKNAPFTKEDSAVLLAALSEISQGNLDNLSNVGSANLILNRVINDQKVKDQPYLPYLKKLSEEMTDISKKNLARLTTGAAMEETAQTLKKTDSWRAFNNSGSFGTNKNGSKMTWEEYRDTQIRPGALANKAVTSDSVKNADGSINQAALFTEMKAQFKAGQEFYKKELERANSLKDPLAATELRTRVKQAEENLKGELLQQATVTQSAASREFEDARDLQDKVQKGARQKGDKAAQIRAIEEKARLEIEYETRAKFDENEIYKIRRGIERKRDQDIENVQGKLTRDGNPTLREAGRVSLAKATAAERQSQAAMDSTKSVASMEDLDKALDEAIAKQFEAEKFRLEAAAAKHANERTKKGYDAELGELNYEEEKKSIADSTQAKLVSLRNNFISLYESASKRLDKTSKYIEETKTKITDTKLTGEDRVYEAQMVPRELDLNLKYNTPSEVSLSVRQEVVRRRNMAELDSIKIELEENQKLLSMYGSETQGYLSELRKAFEQAQLKVTEKEKALADAAPGQREKIKAELGVVRRNRDTAFGEYRDAKNNRNKLRADSFNLMEREADFKQNLPMEDTLENYGRKLDEVFGKYKTNVAQMDLVGVFGKGMADTMGNFTNQLANMFMEVSSGTKTTKEAFRDLSIGVIKSILGIITQMLAMKAVQAGMNFFGFSMPVAAATGGYFPKTGGGIERVKKMASGGPITGGIRGKDSVPVMAMPGEFMLNKRAVDAVGTDFLHGLNAASNSVVSQSQPRPPAKNSEASGVVNVYVVTPDQKPEGMGPRDVIVAVSDDIMRGGSIKKLIKQVQTGAA